MLRSILFIFPFFSLSRFLYRRAKWIRANQSPPSDWLSINPRFSFFLFDFGIFIFFFVLQLLKRDRIWTERNWKRNLVRENFREFLVLILIIRCRYRTEKRNIIGNSRLVSLLAVISDLINKENKRLYFKDFCFVLGYYQMISELDRLMINNFYQIARWRNIIIFS